MGCSANPWRFEGQLERLGYHVRAAWCLDGIEAIEGHRPERFYFIVQAWERPHLVASLPLDEETLEWGRLICQLSRRRFARCLERGYWPGYRDPSSGDRETAITIGLPSWAKRRLEERLDAGEFAPPIAEAAE
jgi:hypothetical protein